jgi:phosphoribosylformimino-5-aminoimidazole carboxamide ribotide isomerase
MITIIPAIDIIDGKCVRLSKGDYDTKKIYNNDPLDMAKQFEDAGIKRLHMVDLDGAKEKRVINYRILEKVAGKTSLDIDFGGGVQSDEDLHIIFSSGAKQVTAGSAAVNNREMTLNWLNHYGQERIILGADAKNGKIAVSGWQENSQYDLIPFLKEYARSGFKYTISTNVDKDGMLEGPDFDIYARIKDELPSMYLIASGGIGEMSHIEKLNEMGIDAVIVGKAIYENHIKLEDLKDFLC